MEDRYLFRAKRLDNGEWIMGLLTVMWGQLHIINPDDEHTAYPIDIETICQCTGLRDKNGNLIWENDIVSCWDTYSTENGLSEADCIGKVVWDAKRYGVLDECSVIGNIFDNPELSESKG